MPDRNAGIRPLLWRGTLALPRAGLGKSHSQRFLTCRLLRLSVVQDFQRESIPSVASHLPGNRPQHNWNSRRYRISGGSEYMVRSRGHVSSGLRLWSGSPSVDNPRAMSVGSSKYFAFRPGIALPAQVMCFSRRLLKWRPSKTSSLFPGSLVLICL
jgi:hypothetical protein